MLARTAKIFTLLAVTSLLVRIGLWKPYTLQPYEAFIIISFLLLLIQAYVHTDEKFFSLIKKFAIPFLAIHTLLVVGTLVASSLFTISHAALVAILKQFFYFYTVSFGFFCVAYFGANRAFRSRVLICMSAPIFFVLFLPFLHIANSAHILGNGFSLIGFSGNPSVLGFYLLIPFGISSRYALYEPVPQRRIIYLALAILSFSLVLWTGSRGAWLACAVLLISLLLHYTRKFSRLIVYCSVVVVSIILSFSILPHPVKVMVLDRVFPQITEHNPSPEVLKTTNLDLSTIVAKHEPGQNTTIGTPLIPYQDRQTIWPQALHLTLAHPFGLGPEYARVSNKIIGPDGNWIIAHNTFLQATLSGGFALLLEMAYLAYYVLKKAQGIPQEVDRSFYMSLWISFLVVLLFNDYLFTIPWVWIVAGLIIGRTIDTSATEC